MDRTEKDHQSQVAAKAASVAMACGDIDEEVLIQLTLSENQNLLLNEVSPQVAGAIIAYITHYAERMEPSSKKRESLKKIKVIK